MIDAGENVAQQKAHQAVKDHIGYSANYAMSWRDNIAYAANREGVPMDKSLKLADSFMKEHFGVDTCAAK